MPSLIRRVHSVLHPGWATVERNTVAKNIRALRKEKGRGARGVLISQYHKSVKAARLQKEKALKKQTSTTVKGARTIKKPESYGVVHKPSKAARRARIKAHMTNPPKLRIRPPKP